MFFSYIDITELNNNGDKKNIRWNMLVNANICGFKMLFYMNLQYFSN